MASADEVRLDAGMGKKDFPFAGWGPSHSAAQVVGVLHFRPGLREMGCLSLTRSQPTLRGRCRARSARSKALSGWALQAVVITWPCRRGSQTVGLVGGLSAPRHARRSNPLATRQE